MFLCSDTYILYFILCSDTYIPLVNKILIILVILNNKANVHKHDNNLIEIFKHALLPDLILRFKENLGIFFHLAKN